MQIEMGEKGTPHIQGFGMWKHGKTFLTVCKLLPDAHWSQCRNVKNSIAYCQKEDSRIDGPWIFGYKQPAKPIKIISTLKPWQAKWEKELTTSTDDRKINWIVDYKGGKGKTVFAKYMCMTHNAVYLTGRAGDMKYVIQQWEDKDDLICIFGYTRSVEEYVSYQGMEEIKDGIFCATKYKSEMCIFNSPQILVLSNFYPTIAKMTKSRWNIEDITDYTIPEDSSDDEDSD